jgi:S1-C subfamily serine protease
MDLGRVEVLAPRIGRPGTFGFVAIARGDVLVVTSVSSAGPAERVSLRVGDEITLIEGRAVSDIGNALAARIIAPGNRTVGDTIRLGLRDREVTLTATGW